MRLPRAIPVIRLAPTLWMAAALVVGCTLPETPATPVTPTAAPTTVHVAPVDTIMPKTATMAPTATATPSPVVSPNPPPAFGSLPADTIALYGVGTQKSLDLYSVDLAGGSTTSIARGRGSECWGLSSALAIHPWRL